MIQRIQSIWLLFGGLCFLAHWLPNIIIATTRAEGPGVFTDMVYYSQESFILLLGSGVSGLLVLVALFLYKERIMQVLITAVASLIQMALGVGLPLYQLNHAGKIDQFTPGLGLWLTAAGLMFCWLATRAIRKDENLVKSMDRLR